MKNILALLLAVALLTVRGGVVAMGAADGAGATGVSGLVTALDHERTFAQLTPEAYHKDNLQELWVFQQTIESALGCTFTYPDGKAVRGICTASWNNDSLTLNQAGSYDVVATLSPPPGCSFAPGVRRQIVLPVRILDAVSPAPIVRLNRWNPHNFAVALAVGAPPETLTESGWLNDNLLEGYGEIGETYSLQTEWDFSGVQTHTTGAYTITGRFVAPPGTYFAPGLVVPTPSVMVSVQQPGRPELDSFFTQPGALCFPYVSLPCSGEEATVWMSKNDEPWVQLTSDTTTISPDVLNIAHQLFEKGNSYRLQMDYPGGQTGIATIAVGDVLDFVGYIGGDRDGGDTNGNPPGNGGMGTARPPSGNAGTDNMGSNDNDSGVTAAPVQAPESPPAPAPKSTPVLPSTELPVQVPGAVPPTPPALLPPAAAPKPPVAPLLLLGAVYLLALGGGLLWYQRRRRL